jgi:hypothetical protein
MRKLSLLTRNEKEENTKMAQKKRHTKQGEPWHTPNGFDPTLIEAINTVLRDRETGIKITDLNQELWDKYIGPLCDELEGHREVNECPECGSEIEATITVYLSNVVLNASGGVESFDIADVGANTLAVDAISDIIDGAEGDELHLYCANDHELGLNGEVL